MIRSKTLLILIITFSHISNTLFSICLLDDIDEEGPKKILKTLTLNEKIGQLFVVGLYPNQTSSNLEGQLEPCTDYVETAICKYHVGGVLFKFFWDPMQQTELARHCKSLNTNIPVMTMQDLEWGLTMRIPSAMRFPKNLTLGAIQDDSLIFEMGKEIAKQSKLLGIDINLSPVMDVNTNPQNPVIGDRSFGENPLLVAKKGIAMMQGLMNSGSIPCLKHFPGHGDTSQDTHTGIACVNISKEKLFETHIYPFQQAINKHAPLIMSSHITLPQIESEPGLPSTFSKKITTEILKEELEFTGIAVTDDLLMKAVSEHWSMQEAAIRSFIAGNDLLITTKDISHCTQAIKDAIHNGRISAEDLDLKVLKILKLKELIKRNSRKAKIATFDGNAKKELATTNAKKLKKNLYRSAITHPKASGPLPQLTTAKNPLIIQIGGNSNNNFTRSLVKNCPQAQTLYLGQDFGSLQLAHTLEKIQNSDCTIIALLCMNRNIKERFGITDSILRLLQKMQITQNSCITLFGNPYALEHFTHGMSCLVAYEDDEDALEAAADVLLGKLPASGRLPVLCNEWDTTKE